MTLNYIAQHDLGLPLVATHPIQFMARDDFLAHEARVCVAEGETLLVLEAMKMENAIAAERAGTVKEVRVEPGQTVSAGDTLVTIE